MKLKKPEAFIFDWDNTLSDAWDVMYEIINSVLLHFNKDPWTMDDVKIKTHRSARDFMPEIFGNNTNEAFEYLRYYVTQKEAEHLKKLTPILGAKELLLFLNDHNIDAAILSNKQGARLRLEVEAMGLSAFFKGGIFGSLDFDYDKPHPFPVQKIKEKNNWEDKNIWFVGDTDVDITCAKNSNCVAVRIDADNKFKDALRFKDCMELFNFLKNNMEHFI
ncbi:MAG: Phosphoglycolate phosphatase [Holosporales bacterium]